MRKAMIDPESRNRNTVALDSHALGTLQYIRASIDAAGLLAVPGSAESPWARWASWRRCWCH